MSLNWKNSRIYGTDEEVKVHGIGKQPAHSWVFSHVPFGVKQCDEKASLSTVWKVEVGRGNSNQGTIMAFEKVSGSFMDKDADLSVKIEEGFGPSGLGIISVSDGITTYEYVVAMRAMSEAPAGSIDDDNQNVIYSPSGSATTGFSGGSSLGLQYKAIEDVESFVFLCLYSTRSSFVLSVNRRCGGSGGAWLSLESSFFCISMFQDT